MVEMYNGTVSTDDVWTDKFKEVTSLFGAVLASIGLILNLMSYKTAKFLDNNSSSMVFFQMLAVWDSIAIIQDGLVHLGGQYFGYDFSTFSSALCKMSYYHSIASTNVANFQLVALCVDRFIAVKFPIWYRSNGKPKFAYTVSFWIFFVNYFVYSPLLYFYRLKNEYCYVDGDENIVNWVIRFHSFVILSGLPFCIILFINVYFISYLNQLKKKSLSMQSNEKDRAERRMIAMLITVGFIFLFLACGTGTGFALFIEFHPSNSEEKSLSDFLKIALEIPLITNSSMNFVFFFLSGKGYRIAFSKMMKAQFQ